MTVWAHHMFTFDIFSNKYFALTSTAPPPAGIEYFDFLATIWRGKPRFTTAFLFALGFLVQFLIGGLTGIILASPPLDYGLNMSYFVVAHFHYTIFAGSAFGLFGGNTPTGSPRSPARCCASAWANCTSHWPARPGANLTFFPTPPGTTRRIARYPLSSGWEGLNIVSDWFGSFVIAVSVLVFIANVATPLRDRRPAGDLRGRAHARVGHEPPVRGRILSVAADPLLRLAARPPRSGGRRRADRRARCRARERPNEARRDVAARVGFTAGCLNGAASCFRAESDPGRNARPGVGGVPPRSALLAAERRQGQSERLRLVTDPQLVRDRHAETAGVAVALVGRVSDCGSS